MEIDIIHTFFKILKNVLSSKMEKIESSKFKVQKNDGIIIVFNPSDDRNFEIFITDPPKEKLGITKFQSQKFNKMTNQWEDNETHEQYLVFDSSEGTYLYNYLPEIFKSLCEKYDITENDINEIIEEILFSNE